MKQKVKEDSEAMQEEVSCAGESSKKGEEDHGKMKHQSSTSLGRKRSEDRQENEGCESPGTPKCKKMHEVTREKKKPRRDEGQKINEKEEEGKRRSQKTSEEEKVEARRRASSVRKRRRRKSKFEGR